ncbi:MAG: MaoC family dehydratase [Cytophagaceae bacterium]
MINVGDNYSETFTLTQEKVDLFAQITGDKNPLHLDAEYAASTVFKKPIIHGMFGAGIISKVLGMNFPGEGTIYLKQDISFKRPMYVDIEYQVVLTIKEVNTDKHTAVIETRILEKEKGKEIVSGQAEVMNKEKI